MIGISIVIISYKGSSINYVRALGRRGVSKKLSLLYLIKFLNFILYKSDKGEEGSKILEKDLT